MEQFHETLEWSKSTSWWRKTGLEGRVWLHHSILERHWPESDLTAQVDRVWQEIIGPHDWEFVAIPRRLHSSQNHQVNLPNSFQQLVRKRNLGLGYRGSSRVRHSDDRGHPRAPLGPGCEEGHLLTKTCDHLGPKHKRGTEPFSSREHYILREHAHDCELAPQWVSGVRLRVGLVNPQPQLPSHLGGAIRWLCQRRADHDRQLYSVRRSQMELSLLASYQPAARLGRTGAWTLFGSHWTRTAVGGFGLTCSEYRSRCIQARHPEVQHTGLLTYYPCKFVPHVQETAPQDI